MMINPIIPIYLKTLCIIIQQQEEENLGKYARVSASNLYCVYHTLPYLSNQITTTKYTAHLIGPITTFQTPSHKLKDSLVKIIWCCSLA